MVFSKQTVSLALLSATAVLGMKNNVMSTNCHLDGLEAHLKKLEGNDTATGDEHVTKSVAAMFVNKKPKAKETSGAGAESTGPTPTPQFTETSLAAMFPVTGEAFVKAALAGAPGSKRCEDCGGFGVDRVVAAAKCTNSTPCYRRAGISGKGGNYLTNCACNPTGDADAPGCATCMVFTNISTKGKVRCPQCRCKACDGRGFIEKSVVVAARTKGRDKERDWHDKDVVPIGHVMPGGHQNIIRRRRLVGKFSQDRENTKISGR